MGDREEPVDLNSPMQKRNGEGEILDKKVCLFLLEVFSEKGQTQTTDFRREFRTLGARCPLR